MIAIGGAIGTGLFPWLQLCYRIRRAIRSHQLSYRCLHHPAPHGLHGGDDRRPSNRRLLWCLGGVLSFAPVRLPRPLRLLGRSRLRPRHRDHSRRRLHALLVPNAVPGWLWIVGFTLVLVLVNAFNVRLFGAVEYSFSALKVTAIVAFLFLGAWVVYSASLDSRRRRKRKPLSASQTTRPSAASFQRASGACGLPSLSRSSATSRLR